MNKNQKEIIKKYLLSGLAVLVGIVLILGFVFYPDTTCQIIGGILVAFSIISLVFLASMTLINFVLTQKKKYRIAGLLTEEEWELYKNVILWSKRMGGITRKICVSAVKMINTAEENEKESIKIWTNIIDKLNKAQINIFEEEDDD